MPCKFNRSEIANVSQDFGLLLMTLSRCQSRTISYEDFYIGDGGENGAFVYLQVLLLEGRTPKQLQETGDELLKIFQDAFKDLLTGHHAQISVHLNEIPANRSYKFNHPEN
ncbi:MAG TPA: hypothetical protein VLF61_01555 [Rhabdochlamydiaceae bacterium]|nr:hypothetical protein [Rhabdochlamydiaceae bacterium]